MTLLGLTGRRIEDAVVDDRVSAVSIDALVPALVRAGYHPVEERAAPEESSGYRVPARPGLSIRLVPTHPKRAGFVRAVHVWRTDARTLSYSFSLDPGVSLLQGAGVVVAFIAVGAALAGSKGWVALLVAAVIMLALPRLGRDDARQTIHEALENALEGVEQEGELDPRISVEPATEPLAASPEVIRVATDSPALAATAKTARDAVVRHEDIAPEDAVEALERAGRRGESGD